MTDLNHRAEQAVLGAMIASGARTGAVGELRTADFADRRHQVVFAALTGSSRGGGVVARLRNWLSRLPHLREARDIGAYMSTLPTACPDPGHLDAYVHMLAQARRQHESAVAQDAADRLIGAAAYLTEQARQLSAYGGRGRPSEPADAVPRDIAALAEAIRVRSPRTGSQLSVTPAPDVPAQPLAGAQTPPRASVRTEPAPAVDASPVPQQANGNIAAVWRATHPDELQELVLADLLQHPEGARPVLDWLPADVFTDPGRRALYEMIVGKLTEGRPVDPLIIAWDSREAEEGSPLTPDLVLRVGAHTVTPGTAAALGRVLLADHVCTQRFGADWQASTLPTKPAAAEPEPEPAVPALTPAAAFSEPVAAKTASANGGQPMILDGPPDLPPLGPELAPRM